MWHSFVNPVKSVATSPPERGAFAWRVATWAYATWLTRGLLASRPWDWLGGADRFPVALDPAAFGPSLAYHFLAYGALGCLVERAYPVSARAVFIGIGHAVLCELAQVFVPLRWFHPADLIANGFGFLLGVALTRRLVAAWRFFLSSPHA